MVALAPASLFLFLAMDLSQSSGEPNPWTPTLGPQPETESAGDGEGYSLTLLGISLDTWEENGDRGPGPEVPKRRLGKVAILKHFGLWSSRF
jgi:hypothetical protein